MKINFLILLQKENVLRICDQKSIEHQPLEKSEKCIEISALVITYQSTDYWLLFINYSLLFDTTNNV